MTNAKTSPLNIIIVTTDEPFFLPLTIHKLLSGSAKKHIKHIILLPPQVGKQTWKDIISEQIRFGFIYFLFRGLQFVCYRYLAKLNISIGKRYFSVKAVATHFDIPTTHIAKINSGNAHQIISEVNPDLIVSLSASQIFKKDTIDLPRLGIINVHNSPLPCYQGLMPSFWVLCNNEKETATTIHFIDEGIDTGGIILQKKVPISPKDTLDSLITKTKLGTAAVLEEVIDLFIKHNGKPPTLPNNPEEATYFAFPQKKDIKKFKKLGKKLLWKNIY